MAKSTNQSKVKSSKALKLPKFPGLHSLVFDFRFGIVLAAIAGLLYINTLGNYYNLDDELVTQNHRLTASGLDNIKAIFTEPYYKDDAGYAYGYRPIVHLSFAIEHEFLGEHPKTSHAINVLLYMLTAFFMFGILSNLFREYNYVIPLIITVLFVVHPIHTEVVASIKNRDELLAFLFGLLSFHHALRYVEGKTFNFHLLGFILFYAMAVLSKSSILAFAVIIPVSLVYFRKPNPWQLLILALPLALLSNVVLNNSSVLFRIIAFVGILALPFAVLLVYRLTHDALNFRFNSGSLLSATDYKNSFAQILEYPKTDIQPAYVKYLLSAFTITLLVVGVFSGLNYFFYAASLLFALSYFTHGANWRRIHMLFLACMLMLMSYESQWQVAYNGVFIGIIYILTLERQYKLYFLPLLCIPIILSLGSFDVLKELIGNFIAPIALFYLIYYKDKPKWGNGIWIFATIINLLNGLYIAIAPLVFFPIIFANKKPWLPKIAMPLIIAISALLISLDLSNSHEQLTSIAEETKTITTELSQDKSLEFTPESERYFDFVENPLIEMHDKRVQIPTSIYIMGYYLKQLFLPYPLLFYYGYAKIEPQSLSSPLFLVSLLVHILLVVLMLLLIRKHPVFSIGVFIYLCAVFLTSNIPVLIAGMMGERLAYTASFGFCIAIGYLIGLAFKLDIRSAVVDIRSFNWPFKICILGLLITSSVYTISRNFLWKDNLTLFKHDIKYLEKSAQANNLLAFHLMVKAETQKTQEAYDALVREAIVYFEQSVKAHPGFFNAQFDLGRALLNNRQFEKAIEHFNIVSTLDTSFSKGETQKGVCYMQLGQSDSAIASFRRAIKRYPSAFDAYSLMSSVYFGLEQMEDALRVMDEALEKAPDIPEFNVNKGKILMRLNRKDEAIISLENSLRFNPNDKEVIKALGFLYQEKGDDQKARYYSKLLNGQ